MALEKFIRGKVDHARHEGKASEKRRLDASISSQKEFIIFEDPYLAQLTRVRKELSEQGTKSDIQGSDRAS